MKSRLQIDPIERYNLTLSAGAIAASLALATPVFTASVALGVALEAVNFRALRRATQQLFAGDLAGSRPWTAAFALRFIFLGAAMYVALRAGAHPIGLLLGLTMIVPAVVIFAWRTRPAPQAPGAAVPPPDDPSWDRWDPWLARERDEEDQ